MLGQAASPGHKQSRKLIGRITPNFKDGKRGSLEDREDQERRFSDTHSSGTSGSNTPKGSPGRLKKKLNGFQKSGEEIAMRCELHSSLLSRMATLWFHSFSYSRLK